MQITVDAIVRDDTISIGNGPELTVGEIMWGDELAIFFFKDGSQDSLRYTESVTLVRTNGRCDTDTDDDHIWPAGSDYCQCHRFYIDDNDSDNDPPWDLTG